MGVILLTSPGMILQAYCWWKKSGDHHLLYMKPFETWDILHINWWTISSINSMFEPLILLSPETNSQFTWKLMVGRRSGFLLGQSALFSWAFAVGFRGGWLIQPSRLSADSTFKDDTWQIFRRKHVKFKPYFIVAKGSEMMLSNFHGAREGNVVSYTHWGKPPGFPQPKSTWLFLHVISHSVRHRNFSMFGRGQALGWWMSPQKRRFRWLVINLVSPICSFGT